MTAAAFQACFTDWRPAYQRGRPFVERLENWSIPIPHCGCWLWLGALRAKRYGSIKHNGEYLAAHRASWMAHKGEIPAGLHVLHSCDVPLCINPDHLFLGTHQDNMDDKERKGRGNQPSGLRNGRHTKPWRTVRGIAHYAHKHPESRQGAKNGRARLTAEQVLEIRTSPESNAAIGRRLGITKTTIRSIRLRKLWRHI